MPELLYKYRSLSKIERILEIIIDRKLYGALYTEMNDPMEGYFQYSPDVDRNLVRNIMDSKNKRYICSLSRKPNIGLMWTHYADENKGCCIEVEVTSKWERLEVVYSNKIPTLNASTTLEDILKVKAQVWHYEEEIRYLSSEESTKRMLTVRINRIIFGYKIKTKYFNRIKKVILALNPSIIVEKMRKEDLDYGYL
ncbi:DUF2971 domain-containing protein [uncultured Prevotellamassilia sp.]|uniref:DUF2971 domain-containing protein n=2 Tax=Prevotellamassilia TaxID=1926672 RepID=UPI002591A5C8|nr:DUF2971 domain-containing protein [uncultured Prevotellamassilia sp.]